MSFGLHHIGSARFIQSREFHNSWENLFFYEYELCSVQLLSSYTWLFLFLWVWTLFCATTLQLHLIIQKWKELVVMPCFGFVCRQSTDGNGVYIQIKLYSRKNSLWGQKVSVNMHS